jgi:hypothetical protein
MKQLKGQTDMGSMGGLFEATRNTQADIFGGAHEVKSKRKRHGSRRHRSPAAQAGHRIIGEMMPVSGVIELGRPTLKL